MGDRRAPELFVPVAVSVYDFIEVAAMANVVIRRARQEEAYQIALLMRIASEGLVDEYLTGIVPGVRATELRSRLVSMGTTSCSYKRCIVAVAETTIVGQANFVPAEKFEILPRNWLVSLGLLPALRLWWRSRRYRAFQRLRSPGSMCIDTIAVLPEFRGQGIGDLLIKEIIRKAKGRGIAKVSLRVWADNVKAQRLYKRHGFEVVASLDLAHGGLAHKGRSLLMVCDV